MIVNPTDYFTSDLHLGHTKLRDIRGQHDGYEWDVMLPNFNEHMTEGDQLYILGDVAFARFPYYEWFDRLTVKNIHIVRGNHDDKLAFDHWKIRSVRDLGYLERKPFNLVMSHYPMISWRGSARGSVMLHGHVHGALKVSDLKIMDVGVDANPAGLKPFSLDDIYKNMEGRELNDHHVERRIGWK